MNSLTLKLGVVFGITVLLTLALAPVALAGDYHAASGLRCSDCHIMHASKDGVLTNGGSGNLHLLKDDVVNDLCLSCHDGTDTTAPDVVATGTAAGNDINTTTDTLATPYTSTWKASGGYFQSDCTTAKSIFGHNLGGGQETAIAGSWVSGANGMACSDCHAPHGSANYRNLLTQPGNAGAAVQVRGGVSGEQEVYLRDTIDNETVAEHYDTDAVRFNDPNNIVAWCKGCHTNIDSSSTSKHPQNAIIASANTDGANWEAGVEGTTPGFGPAVQWTGTLDESLRGIPRLRFAQAGSDYTTSGVVDADTNKVFCLSCHKAHGSRGDSALNWRHFGKSSSSGPDMATGCNQCHAKGT